MQSKLGHASSYTWQGIWEGKKILEKGSYQRVSDGQSIRIWEDYWVPGQGKIISQESYSQVQDHAVTVNTLIVEETRWQQSEKVQMIFSSQVAAEIIKITLQSAPQSDEMFWEPDKQGKYSVLSACQLYKSLVQNNMEGESSKATINRRWWKDLWKMKTPRKIPFAWRVCNDSLPTKQRLQKKQIIEKIGCPFYSVSREDL